MCSWDRAYKDQVDIRGTSPTTIAFILFDRKAVFEIGSCEVTHRRYKSFVRLDRLYKKTSTMTLEISFSSFRIPGRSKRNAHFLVFGEGRYTKLESVFEGRVGRESDFLVFSPLGTL